LFGSGKVPDVQHFAAQQGLFIFSIFSGGKGRKPDLSHGFCAQAKAVLRGKGEQLQLRPFHHRKFPGGGDQGKRGGIIIKTAAGVPDPAFLGAPELKKAAVILPG
jgi:hypothetical protein